MARKGGFMSIIWKVLGRNIGRTKGWIISIKLQKVRYPSKGRVTYKIWLDPVIKWLFFVTTYIDSNIGFLQSLCLHTTKGSVENWFRGIPNTNAMKKYISCETKAHTQSCIFDWARWRSTHRESWQWTKARIHNMQISRVGMQAEAWRSRTSASPQYWENMLYCTKWIPDFTTA